MRVDEFEKKVLELEEIVIRIRAPGNKEVGEYDYERQASGGTSVTKWLQTRINPLLENYEYSIIDGRYQHPHGRTSLQRLRESYEFRLREPYELDRSVDK